MGAIIVDEAGYKEYQRKTDEALKDIESLKNRWRSLFKAMADLIEEAEEQIERAKDYRYEDWYDREDGFWCGVCYAVERLKEIYDDSNT